MKRDLLGAALVADVVAQHAEHAASLAEQRLRAVERPDFTLADLADLDRRLAANLEGLRLSGTFGFEMLAADGVPSRGRDFASAVLGLESEDERPFSALLDSSETAEPLTAALAWVEWEATARPQAERLAPAGEPLARRVAVGAFAAHRIDPGPLLESWCEDEDARVRARALRTIGELGRIDLAPLAREGLRDPERSCALASAWSCAVFGQLDRWDELRRLAESGELCADRVADALARALSPREALAWQGELARDESHRRLAVQVAAAIGDTAALPWLLERMPEPDLSRQALFAFATLTGANLAAERLRAPAPPELERGPSDDPARDDVAEDPDEPLPFPDVERVRAYCERESRRLRPGVRRLLGEQIGVESLDRALREGAQPQRRAAALELARLRPGTPLFEIRARADRQRAQLFR